MNMEGGGVAQPQKHLFQAFNCSSGLQMLAWLKLLVLTGKKLAFELSSYIFSYILILNIAPPSISCPSRVHSCDESAQAFPVFHRFSMHFRVLY